MKNNLLKFTNIVLLITMIAIILVSGTYAKYSSTASGTDATVVANWSFNVNDTDIAEEETFTFNLFDTAKIKDTDGNDEDDVAEGLIAPGTSGAFEFVLENTSDVTAQYEIKLSVDNTNIPIEFSFTGEDNSWTTDLTNLVETDIMEIGGTKNVTVQWRWAFDGATDIALGGQKINVTASITATQLNNTDEVTMLNGDGQTYYTMAPTALSFRSSANIGDFQEVQVNGETIDPSNYTMTEGSTIINLSIDYLKTLAEDDYNISIVSKTGSPSAGFSVVEPDVNSHGFYYNQPYTADVSALGGKKAFFLRTDGTLDVIDVSSRNIETGTFTCDGKNASMTISIGTLTGTWSDDGSSIYCNELGVTASLGDENIVADEDYIYTYDSCLGGYEVKAIDETQASYDPIRTGVNGYPTVKLADYAFFGNTNLTVAPEIPDSVISIGVEAFGGCDFLTSVTIPNGVESIGVGAFARCYALTSVTIPNGVESIGVGAFAGVQLSNVEIPSSVTSIGGGNFHKCSNIIVDENNINYSSLDGVLFNKDKSTLICYPAGKSETSYVVPSGVTTIDGAFNDCKNLISVEIPSSVTNIVASAFYSCDNLINITYEGTMEQWNKIVLDEYWNYATPATTVKCSDGTVTL